MATPNRSAQIAKLQKALKKHYSAVASDGQRPLMEQMLYACCLEDATYTAADEAYTTLTTSYFDWNEVRVSTIRELSESLSMLPEPHAAANNVRRLLQSVFESTYSFDLESLKKQNLGPAVQRLQQIEGVTPFVVAYGVQHALGGHSIPIDRSSLQLLHVVGVISDEELAAGTVPGLERAIPKNKGVDFGSRLHQLAAELAAHPTSTNLHKVLLEIDSEAKNRLPKRPHKTAAAEEPPKSAGERKARPPKASPKATAGKKAPSRKPDRLDGHKQRPPGKKSPASGLAKRKPR